jgi:hypothetical protein
MDLPTLARVLRAAADEADRIAEEQRDDRRDWIPQASSPLGPRRHVRIVRRRLAAGEDGAALIGRQALLSPEALEEEIAELGEAKPRAKNETTGERIERRLGLALVRGAR